MNDSYFLERDEPTQGMSRIGDVDGSQQFLVGLYTNFSIVIGG